MANNYLASTGAFEIYVGEHLAYSKLQTQRLPTLEEIVNIISNSFEWVCFLFFEGKTEKGGIF